MYSAKQLLANVVVATTPFYAACSSLYFFWKAGFAHQQVWNELVKRNDAFNALEEDWRNTAIKLGTIMVGIFAVVYAAVKLYRGCMRAWTVAQGLTPKNEQEVEERDATVNPWKKRPITSVPKTEKQQTTSAAHLLEKAYTNLLHITVTAGTRASKCNAVMIRSNFLLMPKHMWKSDKEIHLFCRRDGDKSGTTFEVTAYWESSYHIPDTDFVVVHAPQSGSYANITDFLPLSEIPQGHHLVVYKEKDGTRRNMTAHCSPDTVGHAVLHEFSGAYAILSEKTFEGLCMAPYIGEAKGALISGFHLGGVNDTKEAIIGTVTQQQIRVAMAFFTQTNGVLVTHSGGEFPSTICGRPVVTSAVLPTMCIANEIEGGTWSVYGVAGTSKTETSKVVTIILSEHVLDVVGIPNNYGPPQMTPNWRHYLRYADRVAHASKGVPLPLLSRACDDWLEPLKKKIVLPYISRRIKPLSDMEALCGIDGRRFIDPLQLSTSVGFPLSGPKTPYIEDLDPKDHPGFACPRKMIGVVKEEYDRIIAAMRGGVRAYSIFSANLKDEPTKVGKTKVRCFQSCPMALSVAVRKWFLPLCWFMSTYPLDTEIAVGINCYGTEWNEMITAVRKFGDHRIFAGDYADYDMTQPTQVIMAAFQCLIDLARATGNYGEEDLTIMRGLATEISDPYMVIAGALYSFAGGNPSGHNLTVYINSIVNCLFHRCAFMEHNHGSFRSCVSLITYGDDFLASVGEGANYDHIVFATKLAEYGMVVTMEDKISEPTPFSDLRTTSFLKRTTRHHPIMGEVAPLA